MSDDVPKRARQIMDVTISVQPRYVLVVVAKTIRQGAPP
jgi:hypothetical protein